MKTVREVESDFPNATILLTSEFIKFVKRLGLSPNDGVAFLHDGYTNQGSDAFVCTLLTDKAYDSFIQKYPYVIWYNEER